MLFRKLESNSLQLLVDFHNHLLPGWDDGSSSMEETIAMVRELSLLGYKKIVFSPHIYPALFPEVEKIKTIFQQTQSLLQKHFPDIDFYLGAEYMMDDVFDLVLSSPELLCFGQSKYLLIEFPLTVFKNKYLQYLQDLLLSNYTPIIAHIERYDYFENHDLLLDFINAGVQLQINYLSLIGYYNNTYQKRAKKLVEKLPEFYLCSDLHRLVQIDYIKTFFAHHGLTKQEQAKILNQRLYEVLT